MMDELKIERPFTVVSISLHFLNKHRFSPTKSGIYLAILPHYMGVIPNPKMAFIFPISRILILIFPTLMMYFPKCEGKGSLPKSQIKSLQIHIAKCYQRSARPVSTQIKLEFRESDVLNGKKQKSNKANASNLYLLAKDYLRETYTSQNINPISPTPKLTLDIIQFIVKSQ